MSSVSVHSGSDDGGGSYHGGGSSSTARDPQTIAINLETMRFHLSSLYAKIVSRVSVDTLRPLPMFLGLNPGAGFCLSPLAFTPPVKKMDKGTPEKIKSRVRLNFAFFLTNYVLVAAMTGLVVALMHPGMVFFLALVYGLWTLHAFLIRNQVDVFGINVSSLLTVQQRFYVLFTITTIVILWKALVPTIMFAAISGLIILSHAFLRDPKHIEMSGNLVDDEDDHHHHHEADDLEGGGADSGESSSSEVLVERPSQRRERETK
jgi:hypothetical protein